MISLLVWNPDKEMFFCCIFSVKSSVIFVNPLLTWLWQLRWHVILNTCPSLWIALIREDLPAWMKFTLWYVNDHQYRNGNNLKVQRRLGRGIWCVLWFFFTFETHLLQEYYIKLKQGFMYFIFALCLFCVHWYNSLKQC